MSEPVIHVLVYRNTSGHGYEITNRTEGFPKRFEPSTKAVTDTFAKYERTASRWMLRYAPLQGNKYYLLSVIGPDPVDHRVTWQMVHFLMDVYAANEFFLRPFVEAASRAYDVAKQFPDGEVNCSIRMPPALLIPPCDNAYSGGVWEPRLLDAVIQNKNVCLSCGEGDPEHYLEQRLAFLPLNLRRTLRFMIDPHGEVKDPEITLYICNGAAQSTTDTTDSYMSRIPAEIPLYDHLKYCIRDWNTFQELGLLVKNGKTTLNDVLKKIPEDEIVRYIQAPVFNLSNDELRDLRDAAKSKIGFHKSPIYEAAVAALAEGNRSSKAARQNMSERVSYVESRRKTDLSWPLFLLLTAVCFMSTALLLMGADPNWSLLSLPTGLAAGYYLGKRRMKVKRR